MHRLQDEQVADETWKLAYRVFEEVLDLPEPERRSYARSAAESPEVLRLVFKLIEDDEREALSDDSDSDGTDSDPRLGTRIGRYQIQGKLGCGGMGHVYSAQDTDLGRRVALKVLAPGIVPTQRALDRLIREAKAASALNHPHIVTVYDVIREGADLAVAMELVEGESLRDHCGCGQPQPCERVIQWGRQISKALAATHEHGIVHRDIKPENLMVRTDGYIKLLDFGLAQQSVVNRITSRASFSGRFGGTLNYMSPEQTRGELVTGSSDVFSLGIVLYELATGEHPFRNSSPLDTAYAIGNLEPKAPSALNRTIPAALDALLLDMLIKDPRQRPSAAEVDRRLGEIADGPAKPSSRQFGKLALVLSAAALIAFLLRGTVSVAPDGRVSSKSGTAAVPALKRIALASMPGRETGPSFSPDGSQVLFTFLGHQEWNTHVYRKVLATGEVRRISMGHAAEMNPIWSRDGQKIAFLRQIPGKWSVMVTSVAAGIENAIGEIVDHEHQFRLLTWHPNGQEVIVADAIDEGSPQLALYSISISSGKRRRVTTPPDGFSDVLPAFSADGKDLAFIRQNESATGNLFVQPTAGGPARQVTAEAMNIDGIAWPADGQTVVLAARLADGSRLLRQPLKGGPPSLMPELADAAADVAITLDGKRLAYRKPSVNDVNVWRYPLGRSQGPSTALMPSTGWENDPRYSPDGKRIALASMKTDSPEIWTCDLDGNSPLLLTDFGERQGVSGSPSWSPDGQRIAFDSRPPGEPSSIYVVAATGGATRRLTGPGSTDILPVWSPDGQSIYFTSDRTGRREIWAIPAAGGQPAQVTSNGGFEVFPTPDGQYLYYTKSPEKAGVWRRPTAGGPEVFVPELTPIVRHRYWQGVARGIYFYDLTGPPLLKFFQFSNRKITTLNPVPAPPVLRYRGLAISPDEKHFLQMQYDFRLGAVIVVDGFR